MPTEIDDRAVIVRDQDPITADMDGELIMMSVDRGNYYGLGETGSRIWQLIESPCPLARLLDQLTDEFDVSRADCRRDLLRFLGQLHAEGLIHIEHESGA